MRTIPQMNDDRRREERRQRRRDKMDAMVTLSIMAVLILCAILLLMHCTGKAISQAAYDRANFETTGGW